MQSVILFFNKKHTFNSYLMSVWQPQETVKFCAQFFKSCVMFCITSSAQSCDVLELSSAGWNWTNSTKYVTNIPVIWNMISIKKKLHMKTPHMVFLSLFLCKSTDKALRSQLNVPLKIFWPRDFALWPMTLTYKLDLNIHPLDLFAKIQVRMSVHSDAEMHRHTHTQMISKLLHPTCHRCGL